jgi:hypothetical protein
MPWYVSVQTRNLILLKDNREIQCVTFQRSRSNPRMCFLAWSATSHDRLRPLPFTYYEKDIPKRIAEAGMTYDWSPVQNQYSYYDEQDHS